MMFLLLFFFTSAAASGNYASYPMAPESTVFVTMRKAELLGIMNCVTESRSYGICQEFSNCNTLFPPRIKREYRRCRQAYTGNDWVPCTSEGAQFPPPAIQSKIFNCFAGNPRWETKEERRAMIQYEMCTRELYANTCMNDAKHYGLY